MNRPAPYEESTPSASEVPPHPSLPTRDAAGWDPAAVPPPAVTPPGPGAPSQWHARRLLLLLIAQFVAFGLVLGVQGVIFAQVMIRLALSEGVFGTAQFALPLVGLVILLFNGPIYLRLGCKWQAITSLLLLSAGMLVIAGTGSLWGFVLALVLSGLGFAMLDAATSAAAMDIEQATGRHVMNLVHGYQSGAIVVGALATGFLLSAGVGYQAIAALSVLVCCLPVILANLPAKFAPPVSGDEDEMAGIGGLLRDPEFVRLAVVCLVGSAAEAIAIVWSVIYLLDLDAPVAISGVTFALFNGAIFVGRLVNSQIVNRFGARVSLLISGVGIAAAALLLLAVDTVPVAMAAFTLLGLAVAGIQPTALSAAGPLAAKSSTGAVTGGIMMSAYLALLVAPLVYGWAAEFWSLRWAMLAVVLCGVVAVLLALRTAARSGAAAPAEAAQQHTG